MCHTSLANIWPIYFSFFRKGCNSFFFFFNSDMAKCSWVCLHVASLRNHVNVSLEKTTVGSAV